jgi:uncharacterized membrane protein YgcG
VYRFAIGAGVALASACVLSTSAVASSGGTSAPSGPVGKPVTTTPGSTAGTIQFVPANVTQGHTTIAEGTLSSADAGQPVSLELRNAKGIWLDIVNRTVAANGSFDIPWRATSIGRYTMRVVSGAITSSAASSSVSTPTTTLQVFQSVIATWYGPGFYGHRTACGQTLTTHILGVANRTLPCGTPVVLSWHGHTITVPVIDRGPYANNATFDLTSATARALTIQETVTLGWLKLPGKLKPSNWYAPGTAPTGSTGSTGSSGSSGASGTSGDSGAGGAQAPS